MKPLKKWLVFDPTGRPFGWPCDTKQEAVHSEMWSEPFSVAHIAWKEAKRQGWTVRKITITEGWR